MNKRMFFKEMMNGIADDPSIFDRIKDKPNINENKIIEYLKKGKTIVACGGVNVDIVNPSKGLAGCPDVKTDGVWIWSGDLAYYVLNYHVVLDDKFIQTMEENDWDIRDV